MIIYSEFLLFLATVNGDTVRNRSPFVRFTITDPATQQITAAGQIPLNSPPPTNAEPNQTSKYRFMFFFFFKS